MVNASEIGGLPLAGVRVLEVDGGLAQFAGKLLADAGADVIKVEPPGGSPARRQGPFYRDRPQVDGSLHFWHYNTSKRSVTLDLADPDGAALLVDLARDAAAVLDGLGRGVMDGYGLGWERLSAANPSLVYCLVTPFGPDGPWAGHRASDLVQLAAGGVMASCGYDDADDTTPIAPSGGQAAHMAGMMAAMGTLAALVHRSATGVGQFVDVAAHDAIAVSTEMAIPFWAYHRKEVRRHTSRHAMPQDTPPWTHRCADGKYLHALPLYIDDRRFAALVEWFDGEGLAEDLGAERYRTEAGRVDEMFHIVGVIGRFCARHTAEEMFREAQARRLPWAPVNSPDELYDEPHLTEDRGAIVPVVHEELGERFGDAALPYRFTTTPDGIRRAPRLGEHNAEILRELDVRDTRLRTLAALGVI